MSRPKIAIVFDMKSDYGIDEEDLKYSDFSYLSEVEYVQSQLNLAGYETLYIHPPSLLYEILKKKEKLPFDIIFNMTEGYKSRNREGIIPAICEAYNICCIGTDSFGASFTLHKYQTKIFLQKLGITTPLDIYYDYNVHTKDFLKEQLMHKNMFPVVIKPNQEGFSMGLTVAYDINETIKCVKYLSELYKQPILIEEMIVGMDIVSAVCGNYKNPEFLGIGRELDEKEQDYFVFGTEDKLDKKRNIVLPPFNNVQTERIKKESLHIYKALKLQDVSRIDWRVSKEGTPYFLECTPLPAWGPTSVFHFFAKQNNLEYHQLLDKIIKLAMERFYGKK